VLGRSADDLISIAVSKPEDAQALAAQLRRSGEWLEVVPGIDSVVVRFDAAKASGAEAESRVGEIIEFIALHTGTEYRVDMTGFTPGFAFIGGLDGRLCVPRRKEPRQRVAAGSVGLADGRTGLYAMASPGGWTLVGRTPVAMFDAHADEPFLLAAGMRVRFHAVAADAFDA
jgi:allophanate hydrolase subunit 1